MSSKDEYVQKKLKSVATFLQRWRGATAKMRELTASHQTLILELLRGDERECLQIGCVGPIFIRGPISWHGSDIVVSTFTDEDAEVSFAIIDRNADVDIRCEELEVIETLRY